MFDIKEQQSAVSAAVSNFKDRLVSTINNLPDNPDIQRINGNCFILSSSKLAGNWTTEFHDFDMQKRYLVELVVSSNPDKVYSKILKAVRLGYYKDSSGYSHSLHSVMIKNLKEALCLGES